MKMRTKGGDGSKEMLKSMFVGVALVFIFVVLYASSQDTTATTSSTYFYVYAGMIPFIVGFIAALNEGSFGSMEFNVGLAKYATVAFVVGAFLYFVYSTNLSERTQYILRQSMNVLSFLMVLFALATLFNIFSNYLLRVGGAGGVFIRLLFFLPCLILTMFQQLKLEWLTGSRLTMMLLACEAALIGLYFAVAYFRDAVKTGIVLQKAPVFLDKPVPIAPASAVRTGTSPTGESVYAASYSLSMQLMVTAPDFSKFDQELNVFQYQEKNGPPKPRITLIYDQDAKMYVMNVYGTTATRVQLTVPFQRWNFLVITYRTGSMDIFVNGELFQSVVLDVVPTYSDQDAFLVGDEHAPVDATIADIRYHAPPLTAAQIANMENFRTPPYE